MPQGPLTPLPSGKLKLGAEHFRKVVRRIEDIKPLAGAGIKIEPKEGGMLLTCTVTAGAGGLPNSDIYEEIEVTVCQNGQPATIVVLGYAGSSNVEPEPD